MDRVAVIMLIHASPIMTTFVVTGGGTQALADLLTVPGASRTLLEALVPYSDTSLAEFLGHAPEQAVSPATAAALAAAAYQRALKLRSGASVPVIGLSCTATLVTDRPKKGAHRAHVGVCDGQHTQVYSLTLQKEARDRGGEERLVSDVLLYVLAKTCGIDVSERMEFLPGEELIIQIIE
jgi:nicotinamide mononucleotide (NMN) deamidase PncC